MSAAYESRPTGAASEAGELESIVQQAPLPRLALARSRARVADANLTRLIDSSYRAIPNPEARLRELCNTLAAQGFSAEYLAHRYNIPQRVTS